MPIGSHTFQGFRVGMVEVQQNVTDVLILRVRLDVYVAPFAVAHPQKSHGSLLDQLNGGPHLFTGEGSVCRLVNQADQVWVMRHRFELSTNIVQREEESAMRNTCVNRPLLTRAAPVMFGSRHPYRIGYTGVDNRTDPE
jgi:hypothetical protein